MPELTKENSVADQSSMAALASEYWKLLQAFERSLAFAPDSAKARLSAQVRYSSERLSHLLEAAGLRIVSFDGQLFEVNLPAIAINAEDVQPGQNYVVERTLEPAVVTDSSVIMTGKVFISLVTSGS